MSWRTLELFRCSYYGFMLFLRLAFKTFSWIITFNLKTETEFLLFLNSPVYILLTFWTYVVVKNSGNRPLSHSVKFKDIHHIPLASVLVNKMMTKFINVIRRNTYISTIGIHWFMSTLFFFSSTTFLCELMFCDTILKTRNVLKCCYNNGYSIQKYVMVTLHARWQLSTC